MIRLIENTDNDSIFEFFSGSDNPTDWTEESPAVWHEIKKHYSYYSYSYDYAELKFELLSDRKWLFVMCYANTKYQFYDYNGWGCYCNIYDGLTRKKIKENYELYSEGYYEYESNEGFEFPVDTLLLFEFYIIDSYSLEYPNNFGANKDFKKFAYNSRYYRDWENKVKGTSWNYVGKVNTYRSLSQCSRNRKYLYDFYCYDGGENKHDLCSSDEMETLVSGCAKVGDIYYSGSISSFQNAEQIYNSGTPVTAIWSNMNKDDGVPMPSGRTENYLGKFETILKVTVQGTYSFRVDHDDYFAMKFNNQEYFLSGYRSDDPLFSDMTLLPGYYPLTAYLQQGGGGHYMRLQWNIKGEGWQYIPGENQCLKRNIFKRENATGITLYAKSVFSASSYETFESNFAGVTESYSFSRPHINEYQQIGSYGTYYSVKMTSYLYIETPGTYVFSVAHDDETAVNINGVKGYFGGTNTSTSNHQLTVTFDESGYYPTIFYLSNSGGGNVYFWLNWKTPGVSIFEEVPVSKWYNALPYYDNGENLLKSLKELRISDYDCSGDTETTQTFSNLSEYKNVSLTFSFSVSSLPEQPETNSDEQETDDESSEEETQPTVYNIVSSTDFGFQAVESNLVIWFKDGVNKIEIPIEDNRTYFAGVVHSSGNAIVMIDDKIVAVVSNGAKLSNNVFAFGSEGRNISVSKFRLYSEQLLLDELKHLYYRGQ